MDDVRVRGGDVQDEREGEKVGVVFLGHIPRESRHALVGFVERCDEEVREPRRPRVSLGGRK